MKYVIKTATTKQEFTTYHDALQYFKSIWKPGMAISFVKYIHGSVVGIGY